MAFITEKRKKRRFSSLAVIFVFFSDFFFFISVFDFRFSAPNFRLNVRLFTFDLFLNFIPFIRNRNIPSKRVERFTYENGVVRILRATTRCVRVFASLCK